VKIIKNPLFGSGTKNQVSSLLYKSGDYETRMVGTVSADGSSIQVGNTEVFGSYSLREGRLVGCGSKRGGSVVYDSVSGSYATWCDDFKAK
jgi:hypothetical protein